MNRQGLQAHLQNIFNSFYKHKNLALAGFFVFFGLLFFSGVDINQARAERPIDDWIGTSYDYTNQDTANAGFSFTPQVDGEITSFWVRTQSNTSHVRLYDQDDSGNELFSDSVDAQGESTWVEIIPGSPISLTAGHNYVLAQQNDKDYTTYCDTLFGIFPYTQGNIVINEGRYDYSTSAMPTSSYNGIPGIVDFTFVPSNAVDFTSVQNGNWSDGTTWGNVCSGFCVPGVNYPSAYDVAKIADSTTVTLDAPQYVEKLIIDSGGTFNAGAEILLILGGGTPFVVNGNFNAGTGTISYSSSSGVTNMASGNVTGSNAFYHLSMEGTGSFINTDEIEVSGDFYIGSGSIEGGTFIFSGSDNILNIQSTFTPHNVTISSGALITTNSSFGFDQTGGSNFIVNGTYVPGDGVTVNGDAADISGSGTFKVTTDGWSFYDQYPAFNNYNLESATVDYTATDNIVSGVYYGTLKVSGQAVDLSGTVYVGNSLIVTGSFTTNSGELVLANATISNSGTLQLHNLSIGTGNTATTASSLTLSGALVVYSTGSFTASAGTITLNNGASIAGPGSLTLNNLTVANSATVTSTVDYTVNGTLTVGTGATLNSTAGTITLSSTGTALSTAGTFNPTGTNTVRYTGATATIPARTFQNLTLGGTGTYTMPATTLTINGNLSVTSGANITKGAGTIVFAGSSPQTISDSNGTKRDLGNIQNSNTTDSWCNLGSTVCDSTWTTRKKITFANGTVLSGNLTNFALLVSLNSFQIDYAKTLNDGKDIRFVDGDGTALSYEVEKWDESGTSTVWVKIPTLSNSGTDYIYMYYNNPLAIDNQSSSAVWDTSYRAVWHLPNGTTLSAADSTTNARNGTVVNTTATTGKVGGGASFNGSTKYIQIPSSVEPSYPTSGNTSSYTTTFETWFKTSTSGVILGQTDGTIPNSAPAGYTPAMYVDTNGKLRASLYYHSGTQIVSSSSYNDDSWHHVVDTYNNGTETLYVDGNSVGSQSSVPEYGYAGSYGYFYGTGYATGWTNIGSGWVYFNGTMDEMRFSSTARSADWVKGSYYSAIGALASFGTEQSLTASSLSLASSVKVTSLTVDSGKSFSPGSYTLTLTGNGSPLVVNGTFVPSTGTIEFASAATTGTNIPALAYNTLSLDKAGNTFTASTTFSTNYFYLMSGTFVAPSENGMTISTYLYNNGTFNPNGGNVILSPTAGGIVGVEASQPISFYDLTNTVPDTTVTFSEGGFYTIAHSLIVTGSQGKPIWLKSATQAEPWTITFSSTADLSYVNVKDSDCGGGSVILPRNSRVNNQGNNGSCWGFVVFGPVTSASGGAAGSSSHSSGGGVQSGGSSSTTDTFTTTSTWVAPAGVTSVIVEAWGAGGRGANGDGFESGGGGGGGGAYSKKLSISVTPGNSYTVTVGVGGSTGTPAGGDSWFSTSGTVLAKGGAGGNSTAPGAGGASGSGIGDTKYSGGTGGSVTSSAGSGGGGGAGTTAIGGNGSGSSGGAGGSTSGGTGGSGGGFNSGFAGSTIGGGGGGGGQNGSGANGARGEVKITYTPSDAGSGGSSGSGQSGNSGTVSGATFSSDTSVGTTAFVSPSNVSASDNTYATKLAGTPLTTYYLTVTNFNFSIPSNATVAGIEVNVEGKKSLAQDTGRFSNVKLILSGSISGTSQSSSQELATSDSITTFGSSSNLWGNTLTPAVVNASNFGVGVSMFISPSDVNTTVSLDHITMKVYYAVIPGQGGGGGGASP